MTLFALAGPLESRSREPGDVSTPVLSPSPSPSAAASSALPSSPTRGSRSDFLIGARDELAALPMDGPAWATVLSVADADLGTPDLADQDSTTAGRLLAAALVYTRTGQDRYREKVEAVLSELPGSDLEGARSLSVGRQLAGYVIAADLVGYRDPRFVDFVASLRTRELDGHDLWTSLHITSEETASNWGTWALASRIAVSAYVGDQRDVDEAALVFRGYTGDRRAYDGFGRTAAFDASFACDAEDWVPINPACGELGGALVEDISRSRGSFPDVDDRGRMYSWEGLGGATLSAELLSHAGYPDAWEWGDQALLRAARFLHRNGGYPPEYSVSHYIPHMVNKAYGVDLEPLEPAGYGRQFGYTDWLR